MNGYGIFAQVGLLLRRWKQPRSEDDSGAAKQVTLPKHGVLTIATSMDLLGMNCLRTNLLIKKALGLAGPGEILEIITDNPSSAETIPYMLPNYGCVHLATVHNEPNRTIYVKKFAS